MKPLPCLLIAGLGSACATAVDLSPEAVQRLGRVRALSGGTGRVEAWIQGAEGSAGVVRGALFISPDGFPASWETAYSIHDIEPSENAVLVFERVPAGEFALLVYHDLDGNEQLDADESGVPTEPWGVTRGARGSLAGPTFSEARVRMIDNQALSLDVPISL